MHAGRTAGHAQQHPLAGGGVDPPARGTPRRVASKVARRRAGSVRSVDGTRRGRTRDGRAAPRPGRRRRRGIRRRLRRRRKRRLIHQTSERTRRRHIRARNATHEASSKLRRHPSRRGVFARRRLATRASPTTRVSPSNPPRRRRRFSTTPSPSDATCATRSRSSRGKCSRRNPNCDLCSTFGWTSPRRRRRGGRRNGAFAWRGRFSPSRAPAHARARFSFPSRTPRRRRFVR